MNREQELAHLHAPSVDPKQRQVDYWGQRAERAEGALARLRAAAMPFAEHDWMDAELEGDSCKLTQHSGKVTVGHWRRLREALGIGGQPITGSSSAVVRAIRG